MLFHKKWIMMYHDIAFDYNIFDNNKEFNLLIEGKIFFHIQSKLFISFLSS